MRIFATMILLAVAGPTLAQEVSLGTGPNVLVWQDGDSMSEGFKLIEAGVQKSNPEMILGLLSCIVPTGTQAIITDHGFATHTILITSGDNAGCRGDVVAEDVK